MAREETGDMGCPYEVSAEDEKDARDFDGILWARPVQTFVWQCRRCNEQFPPNRRAEAREHLAAHGYGEAALRQPVSAGETEATERAESASSGCSSAMSGSCTMTLDASTEAPSPCEEDATCVICRGVMRNDQPIIKPGCHCKGPAGYRHLACEIKVVQDRMYDHYKDQLYTRVSLGKEFDDECYICRSQYYLSESFTELWGDKMTEAFGGFGIRRRILDDYCSSLIPQTELADRQRRSRIHANLEDLCAVLGNHVDDPRLKRVFARYRLATDKPLQPQIMIRCTAFGWPGAELSMARIMALYSDFIDGLTADGSPLPPDVPPLSCVDI